MRSDDRHRLGVPRWVLSVVLVATTVSALTAQKPTIAPNRNHLVAAANDASGLQRALEGASSIGMHVMFGSHDGVLLSRAQVPDSPSAYRAIRENRSDRFERALNAAGEQSFRLMPTTLTRSDRGTRAVTRRVAGAARYRYRVVPATDGMTKIIQDLALKGFSLVGVFTQQSGMASTVLGRPGRLYAVLEASDGVSTSHAATTPASHYRVVSALRASTVENEVKQAAGEGYRVVGGSFMNVLLERREGSQPEHVYRVIGAIRGKTLQTEIDEAGRAGFRVVPTAIMSNPNSKAETVVVMERTPPGLRRYEYEWVSVTTLAGSRTLDDVSEAGFAPIALWRQNFLPLDEFGNPPDADADDYFILMEKYVEERDGEIRRKS